MHRVQRQCGCRSTLTPSSLAKSPTDRLTGPKHVRIAPGALSRLHFASPHSDEKEVRNYAPQL